MTDTQKPAKRTAGSTSQVFTAEERAAIQARAREAMDLVLHHGAPPVDQLVLEFARKGYDDLALFKRYTTPPFLLGLGVIDVKSLQLETPDQVAARVRKALQVLPPERLTVNPDCGLRHVPPEIALAKLQAMSQGTDQVRRDVLGQPANSSREPVERSESQPTGNAA